MEESEMPDEGDFVPEPLSDAQWLDIARGRRRNDDLDAYLDGPLKGKVVRIDGYAAVAWDVIADDGVCWVAACMVGDDHTRLINRSDCVELAELAYCHECGQMGCGHDGLDRTEAECAWCEKPATGTDNDGDPACAEHAAS